MPRTMISKWSSILQIDQQFYFDNIVLIYALMTLRVIGYVAPHTTDSIISCSIQARTFSSKFSLIESVAALSKHDVRDPSIHTCPL